MSRKYSGRKYLNILSSDNLIKNIRVRVTAVLKKLGSLTPFSEAKGRDSRKQIVIFLKDYDIFKFLRHVSMLQTSSSVTEYLKNRQSQTACVYCSTGVEM